MRRAIRRIKDADDEKSEIVGTTGNCARWCSALTAVLPTNLPPFSDKTSNSSRFSPKCLSAHFPPHKYHASLLTVS